MLKPPPQGVGGSGWRALTTWLLLHTSNIPWGPMMLYARSWADADQPVPPSGNRGVHGNGGGLSTGAPRGTGTAGHRSSPRGHRAESLPRAAPGEGVLRGPVLTTRQWPGEQPQPQCLETQLDTESPLPQLLCPGGSLSSLMELRTLPVTSLTLTFFRATLLSLPLPRSVHNSLP